MPNHVRNVIKIDMGRHSVDAIMGKLTNENGFVDFEVLLPVPLNCWMHSSSSLHDESFPNTALSWCKENWSTKWNAYDQGDDKPLSVKFEGDDIVLSFNTAWSPPRGWVCAVFNTFKTNITHDWHDEGAEFARQDTYIWSDDMIGARFATELTERRMWPQ